METFRPSSDYILEKSSSAGFMSITITMNACCLWFVLRYFIVILALKQVWMLYFYAYSTPAEKKCRLISASPIMTKNAARYLRKSIKYGMDRLNKE
jgi:hypothetical protein